jgi:hypothetical protein
MQQRSLAEGAVAQVRCRKSRRGHEQPSGIQQLFNGRKVRLTPGEFLQKVVGRKARLDISRR